MEASVKKAKFCWDSRPDYPTRLAELCSWTNHNNVAIEYHNTFDVLRIKYIELNDARLIVSNVLESIKGFQFIGINCDICAHCVPALMLGILSRNMAFVNLPLEAVVCAELIKQLCIRYVFAQKLTSDATKICQLKLHGECIHFTKLSDSNQCTENRTANLYAYAISTSGSTGAPKIIKVPHSCILPNIFDLQKMLEITEADKIAQMTSFTFDPSIVEIFLSLASDSTLFVPSKELINNPSRLLQAISNSKVTVLQTTPSLLLHRWSCEDLKQTILSRDSSLRILLLGGEPMPSIKVISRIKHSDNATKIFNVYGITEVSCWSSIVEIPLNDEQIDSAYLGEALSETIFEVRNDKGEILNSGEGSLYIGSNTRICSIGDERIDDFEKIVFRSTGDVVAVRRKNEIFYRGRRNRIMKRYGHRLNLQVLDSSALELSFVQNSFAFWDEKHHTLHLCLHVTQNMTEPSALKRKIFVHLEKLPSIYKPDKIHCLGHFELTDNGKVSPSFIESVCVEDETGNGKDLHIATPQREQEAFANIWNDQFGSISGGFLKLGGTSVLALQMSRAIMETLKIELPELIGMLLKDATFEKCLTYIRNTVLSSERNSIFNSLLEQDRVKINVHSDEDLLVQDKPACSGVYGNTDNFSTFKHKCRGKTSDPVSKHREDATFEVKVVPKVTVQTACNLQKCVDASPTVFEYANGKSFVTVGSHAGIICTVELHNNMTAHEIQLPDRIEASCLVLNDFKAIVGCYDGYIYCLNLKTGTIIWRFQTGDIIKCTAITCKEQNNVFVGSYDRSVYCISVGDGSIVWKNDINNGSISATGCLHNQTDSVLFGTLGGSCVALDQLTGKTIWTQTLKHPIFVAPVTLRNGLAVFCSVAGSLVCYNIVNDEKIWTYVINGNIFSYPLVQFDPVANCECIIVGSENKRLYCLEVSHPTSKTEPTLKFALDCESPIFATPWCENGLIFIACTNGTCLIYSFLKGELTTSIKLPGDVFSSPVIHNEWVFVGCRDDNLYILNLI